MFIVCGIDPAHLVRCPSAYMNLDPAILTAASRRYRDSHDREWRVFERQKPVFGGGSITVLIFESGVSFRSVRTYPHAWRELSAEDLERLSWQV